MTKKETNKGKSSNSPNSLAFYLKRFDNDEEIAKKELEKYRTKMRGKLKRPNQISYWIDKGYSEEEAKKRVSESQSKRGKGKRINSPFTREVSNYMINMNINYGEAYEIACTKRRSCSPRRKEYWISRGYSEKEAENKISEIQKTFSKRCLEYWVGKGHSEEEAKKLLYLEQDKRSLKAIMEKFDCSLEEALQVSKDGEDEVFRMMLLYFTYRVRQATQRVYNSFKDQIDPNNLRGKGYHLDHKVSIKQCFIEGKSIEETAALENLEIVTEEENLKKRKY